MTVKCLKGLLETDGSLYTDRGYKMINFTTIIPILSKDLMKMINNLGFTAHLYKIPTKHKTRYNIRISRDVEKFIKTIKFNKQ